MKLPLIYIAAIIVILTVFFDTSKRVKTPPPTFLTTQPEISSEKSDLPRVSTVATNLEVPWALAFLPNRQIIVTERPGRIRLVDSSGKLTPKTLVTLPQVKQSGESGLHGIAIDPDFAQKPYVYFYYTYSANDDNSLNKVSRFTYADQTLKDETTVVDKIPGAIFHDGGRIKFGPDGFLYITTGDAQNPSLSQDKNSLAGKILRVKDDKVEVYSYGHRNPQGIAWDDQERLWETEHGQTNTDEVNLIEEGKNYGWPTIRGDQTKVEMVNPKLHSGINTWAPAGMAFFNSSIFYGGLRGQALFQLNLSSLELKEHFKGQFGRIRDVVLGPDNMLYITTSNRDGRGNPLADDDKILRINPDKL